MNIYTCNICQRDFKSTGSLSSHKNWHNPEYAKAAKAGGLSSINRAATTSAANANLIKSRKIIEYEHNPSRCTHCSSIMPYEQRGNKFCGHHCSASYLNIRRGPESVAKQKATLKETLRLNPRPITPKILTEYKCIICEAIHYFDNRKTCSPECYSKLMSIYAKGKLGGNRNCNWPGIDSFGKKFYYDSNWEITLTKSFDDNNIKWQRPDKFILSDGRAYTPDFYLPEYDIFLDPKAKRPGYYRYSVLKIEMFEIEFNTKCIVISNPKLLSWYHVQTLMLVQTFRS